MSGNTETGHAKNASNFENLITIATNLGANYTPSNAGISVAGMQTALNNARAALTVLKTDFNTWKNATNNREIAFEPIKHLSTQLLNILISTGAPAQTVKDFKTINAKIQGSKISKPTVVTAKLVAAVTDPVETLPATKTISASQQSFNNLADHFEKAVILLGSVPAYAPSETNLTVAALQSNFTNLQALNTAAFNSATTLGNSRINRDKVLYTNPDSLYELAKVMKAYIKGKYGATSREYKQVSAISVRKVTAGK